MHTLIVANLFALWTIFIHTHITWLKRNYKDNSTRIFTAQGYASAAYAVIVSPSVHHKSEFYEDG